MMGVTDFSQVKKAPKLDQRLSKVGERLKELRTLAGYTSYENFAYEYNLPRVQYGRMEKGANCTMKSLIRVIEIHEISLETFFKGID